MTAPNYSPHYKRPRLLLEKKQVVLAIILPLNKHGDVCPFMRMFRASNTRFNKHVSIGDGHDAK